MPSYRFLAAPRVTWPSVKRGTPGFAPLRLSEDIKMWTLVSLAFLLASVATAEEASSSLAPVPSNATNVTNVTTEGTLQKCLHLPVSECPVEGSKCKHKAGGAVICCHLNAEFELKEGLASFNGDGSSVSLHIHNATFRNHASGLNASFFDMLSYRILNLTISDSQVGRIEGHFPGSLTCLNLSGNALTGIADDALRSLHDLATLDISRNNLTTLPNLTAIKSIPFWLDLSGSNELQCFSITDMRKQMPNLSIVHDNDTFCNMKNEFNWFTSTERVLLTHLEELSMLEKKCPHKESLYRCKCKPQRLQLGPERKFTVSVNCSGQQLTELPEELPPNTDSLDVSNNSISSLRSMANNQWYAGIRVLRADDNNISSMSDLELMKFIDDFDMLSLRNNKITEIQIYILANAFSNASSRSIVMLGRNNLKCDCNTAKEIKIWLSANKKHIKDYHEIYCDGDPKTRVIDLVDNLVCVGGVEFKMADYIYYVIAGEIALLLLLVIKVTYDYWIFKTAGYLPWPASKMPKLPCDCFFEK